MSAAMLNGCALAMVTLAVAYFAGLIVWARRDAKARAADWARINAQRDAMHRYKRERVAK